MPSGLRALEQDRVTVRHLPLEHQGHVLDLRPQPLAEAGQVAHERVPVHLGLARGGAAERLVVGARLAQLVRQRLRPEQVAHAHAAAARLVLVGRADTTQRGPDLALPALLLGQGLERAVVRQDQVRAVGDHQVVLERDPAPLQLAHLLLQRPGVDHHAVAHHAEHAVVQRARGDQAQHELLAVHVDGVAGVVAAVVAGDHLDLLGEEVHDLAFAFVAPLGARDHDVGHVRP
jgi:hypothetical protein